MPLQVRRARPESPQRLHGEPPDHEPAHHPLKQRKLPHATGDRMLKANADAKMHTLPQKPKTLVCYICGREFGTASLEIHLKSCQKKWELEQEKKPAN